ncbi:hypothetical protein Dimus_016684 [Dionaea muscipula]
MEESEGKAVGLEYWLKWQVGVCALIILLPSIGAAVIALKRIRKKTAAHLRNSDLWLPCWKELHPVWLLLYRASAFLLMAWILYQMVRVAGSWAFLFYTQWTFALVIIYFAIGTIISAQGCIIMYSKPANQVEEREKFQKNEKSMNGNGSHKHYYPDKANDDAAYLGHFMLVVYQTCAGAVLMTDIVFWCVLVPMLAGKTFEVTLLIGCIHSLNFVFLLIDSALNRLPFGWFGFIYFMYWSILYIVFQWAIHFRGLKWWPYPFLDISSPWAPLWYFGLTLFHFPCYAIYDVIVKGKAYVCYRLFPNAFVRWY